ncbi:SDR family oxidoreductase [Neisseria sp. ZJ106]|uniref:SDR family oxidoreductase n=1 Tax=Neisseria lisongii TaxID=2912188 RepID=A0ABY7RK18_9NEIS|nr:SDR family oxidoreductase [Neisseria lisongii]MCF7521043.1 SDR family oxidoreductase [Neisseria lisongii]WCL71974.1 SDR family oxidoreductase [Neisseria lisongii]
MAILITGASAGFGEAMCRTFAAAGYAVIGAARRVEKLNQLAAELGGNFYALQMDVADTQSVRSALDSLPEPFREIDCLINNAGLALGLDAAHEADFADWETMIQTNIVGLAFLTRQVLPQMVARKSGYIMNLGSIAGTYPYPGGNVYGATKAFVRQFSLNLRADLAGTGVRVSNIEPGLCGDTEFSQVRFKGDGERAAKVYEHTQFILPQDIADTALWLYQRPAHMNVNTVEIMPVSQSFGALPVAKNPPPTEKVQDFDKQSTSLFAKIKAWFK